MIRTSIGITGGIGSGKSVVSRILRLKGYPVYDCDMQAKVLMEVNAAIRKGLVDRFGSDTYGEDGKLNRRKLADLIFNDAENRGFVNSLVHREVRMDIRNWLANQDTRICFVESAILFSSGIAEFMDRVWLVDAPLEMRLERVLMRGEQHREDALARIEAQNSEFESMPEGKVFMLMNDGSESLLEEIDRLLLSCCQDETPKLSELS